MLKSGEYGAIAVDSDIETVSRWLAIPDIAEDFRVFMRQKRRIWGKEISLIQKDEIPLFDDELLQELHDWLISKKLNLAFVCFIEETKAIYRKEIRTLRSEISN